MNIEMTADKNKFGNENENENGIGNTYFICGAKKRICGKNKCGIIGTYILILVPTLAYAIIM